MHMSCLWKFYIYFSYISDIITYMFWAKLRSVLSHFVVDKSFVLMLSAKLLQNYKIPMQEQKFNNNKLER